MQTPVEKFAVAAAASDPALESAIQRGRILADAQNFTRELVNEPANLLTPTLLASRARADGRPRPRVRGSGQDRMRQLGMGSLLGVAQGSASRPR